MRYFRCPHCLKAISDLLLARHLARKGGESRSEAKVAAAKINAKLNPGRPKGAKYLLKRRRYRGDSMHPLTQSHFTPWETWETFDTLEEARTFPILAGDFQWSIWLRGKKL